MKIINEYSVQNIKKNKFTSFSLMLTIFIASVLVATVVIFAQSFWQWCVDRECKKSGNWDARMIGIMGSKVETVQNDKDIENIYLKGSNETTKFVDIVEQPYLLIQKCNESYWNNMPEQYLLLDGRLPQAEGEIVIEKKYFVDHPECTIGNKIILQNGMRYINEQEMDFLSIYQDGESFVAMGQSEYTIVGSIDISINSAYHGYAAYGYIDKLNEDDTYIVYLRFRDLRKTFKLMPQILESCEANIDESGNYYVEYNKNLLRLYAVLDKQLYNKNIYKVILIAGVIVTTLICIFCYILRNAFLVSQKARNRQLGILKSIGASPGQLWKCVVIEGLLLSIIPIPLAIFVGLGFTYFVISKYAGYIELLFTTQIPVSFSGVTIIAIVLICLLAVILSISSSAKAILKMSPIDLIRQRDVRKERHKVKHRCERRTQQKRITIELGRKFLSANKRAYRTCMVVMGMCFVLIFFFLCTFIISDISNSNSEDAAIYNVNLTINLPHSPDAEMLEEIREQEEVLDSVIYADTNVAIWLPEEKFSDEFVNTGSLNDLVDNSWILEQDGKYRVTCTLVGLEEKDFRMYCENENITTLQQEGTEKIGVIIVNQVTGASQDNIEMPYVSLMEGNNLKIFERFNETIDSNYETDVMVIASSEKMPQIDLNIQDYSLYMIMELGNYYRIVENFLPERQLYHHKVMMNLACEDKNQMQLEEKIDQICGRYLSSSDYFTSSRATREIQRKQLKNSNMLIVYAITVLLGMIGISSGVFAVLNSVQSRRRYFAMLKSIGLDEESVCNILKWESRIFSIKPFLFSFPVLVILICIELWMFHVSWMEFIPRLPIVPMVLYVAVFVLALQIMYCWGSHRILKDKIIDVIKKEFI